MIWSFERRKKLLSITIRDALATPGLPSASWERLGTVRIAWTIKSVEPEIISRQLLRESQE